MIKSDEDRVRELSLDLNLAELAGRVEPPDLVAEITRRRKVAGAQLAAPEPAEHRDPRPRLRKTPWLAAALVVLALGATTWVHVLGNRPAPTVTGPLVFVIDGRHLLALDLDTGAELWRSNVPNGDYGTPVLHGGIVYAGSRDGHLLAFTAASGKLAWRRQVGGGGYTFDGREPIVVHADQIICSLTKTVTGHTVGSLVATSAKTGKVAWRMDAKGAFRGPLLHRDRVYAACRDGKLYAVDPATGTKLWARALKMQEPNVPVAHGDLVFVSGDRQLFAVSADKGAIRWGYKAEGCARISAPLVMGNRMIVATERLTALSLRHGRVAWQSEGIGSHVSLAATRDLLLVADTTEGGRLGRLSAYRPDSGHPRWARTLLSGPLLGVATHNGTAYVVTRTAAMAFRAKDSKPGWNVKLENAKTGPLTIARPPAPAAKQPAENK